MEILDEIRMLIREIDVEDRYFSDEEIRYYFKRNNQDVDATVYELLILKSEDDSCKLPSGIEVSSSKDYWLMLARKYRPNRSRVI